MDETTKSALIDAVIALAKTARPGVHTAPKYGGTVFLTDPDTPSSLAGGVFSYSDYVSVEFSHGATFADPDNMLEGKGKARRHVKLRGLSDLESKDVAGFLAQAFAG